MPNSTGAYTIDDISAPKGQFTAADLGSYSPEPAGGAGADTDAISFGQMQRNREQNPGLASEVAKTGLTSVGASVAPELLPEMSGGGILGYLTRLFARSGASGAGAAVGNAAGQAVTGGNPFSKENLKESAGVGLSTAALSAPLEAIGQLPSTKLGRSAINQSLGAQTRDVLYGNPAQAILREDIGDVATGDYEAYKDALRAGKTPAEASQAAGGRFAAVNQRISELAPRLDRALAKSQAPIPVKDVIDKPLESAALDVIANPAMTDAEKDAAINQFGALQKALKERLGQTATPSQLQIIKRAIGDRVNWGGNIAVTDEVKPAYRAVYASLKNAIDQAVPESAPINERLTNLYAAKSDLDTFARAEEVGRGGGITGGKIGTTLPGLVEREAGRVLPLATALKGAPPKAAIGAAAGLAGPLWNGDQQ